MKAKVFIMVMAFHILVVAGLYLLSACSTKDGPVSAIGPPAPQVEESPRPQFRAPTRPDNPETFAIEEKPITHHAEAPELDPVFNAGTELADSTSDPDLLSGMVYVVESGDTLWSISTKHGVSLDDLLTANSLTRNSTIGIGQKITIPIEGQPEFVPETSDVEVPEPLPVVLAVPEPSDLPQEMTQPYTVVAGDTLSGISRRFNTRVEDVMAASGLNSHNLQVGQVLSIPVNSISTVVPSLAVQPVPEVSPEPASEQGSVVHIVQPGETTSGIAKKYGISVAKLMDDNQISDPRRIFAGEELKIYLSDAQPLEPLSVVEDSAPPPVLDAPLTPAEFDESVFDDLQDIPEVEVAPQ
ncbi:MAG: LysM peptidoglycan-binding domain-containing protein [Opitutae bacterium]|nr:LysM peptidoglycan-binding domain-containing protein [Opitutae bacterium]